MRTCSRAMHSRTRTRAVFSRALARHQGILKHATVPAQERAWHGAVGGAPLPRIWVRARTRTCVHVLFLACAGTLKRHAEACHGARAGACVAYGSRWRAAAAYRGACPHPHVYACVVFGVR